MNQYTEVAKFYDHLLKHVDYDEWYRHIKSIMYQYCYNPKKVLEIGTGTGKFGAKFSQDKIEIYGMDKSIDMLKIASQRSFDNFRVFCADATNFKLSKKFDFIFAVHDTMNYILDKKDLTKVFTNVASIMDENSIFLFDTTTEFNIKTYFNNKTNKYNLKKTKIKWSNTYNEKEKIINSTLEFKKPDGTIYVEEHLQRIYAEKEIKKILKKCKLEILDIFGDYTFAPYNDKTIMINYIVRKKR